MLRIRRLGIDTCHETVAYLARRCPLYRAQEFVALARIEISTGARLIAVPALDQAYEFSYREGRWIAALSNAEAAPRLSVEEVTATRDWHNEYAQTLLDLRSALNRATDNRVRRRLLREVRRVIDEAHR